MVIGIFKAERGTVQPTACLGQISHHCHQRSSLRISAIHLPRTASPLFSRKIGPGVPLPTCYCLCTTRTHDSKLKATTACRSVSIWTATSTRRQRFWRSGSQGVAFFWQHPSCPPRAPPLGSTLRTTRALPYLDLAGQGNPIAQAGPSLAGDWISDGMKFRVRIFTARTEW